MNAAAWAVVIPLVLAAAFGPWLVSKVKLGKLTADVQWAVGALAVLCTVGAGVAARGTFIGRDIVPAVAGLSTWTRLGAAVVFVAAVGVAFLAVLPDRLVAVPADQAAAVAGFIAPLLAGYAQWGIGSLGASALGFLSDVGAPVVAWVTQS